MTVDFEAIPRKGETIIFNRTEELDPNDIDFLDKFYGDDDFCPELIVSDVLYHTAGNYPVILLEKIS
jgi:hypothetical protein